MTQHMPSDAASKRFGQIANRFATSEVHSSSPTLTRLRELVQEFGDEMLVCDVAAGAGHTGFAFADRAASITLVDPAASMLEEGRELATRLGIAVDVDYVECFAESLALASATFDVVVSRLAPHHFSDVAGAVREMARVARPGGVVAIIDLQGADEPRADELNHRIEELHDPTHVRSYGVAEWRALLEGAGLTVTALEGGHRESPAGVPVKRWCEIADSGPAAEAAIRDALADADPALLRDLDIAASDGEFRVPVRTVLAIARKDEL